jgi:hypothetical protein
MKTIGYIVPMALLFRRLLSLVSSLYAFAGQCWDERIVLWPSGAREAWRIARLLPFAWLDLSLRWCPIVSMTDASLSMDVRLEKRDSTLKM